MEHKPWKTLSSRPIYQNPWMSLREDIAEMPDGRTTIYWAEHVVTFGDCVGVVPFLDRDRILLVRQYRYVQKDARWEIPTGGLKEGESLEEAARRELQEETGYQAERLTWISSYYTSKCICLWRNSAATRQPISTSGFGDRGSPQPRALWRNSAACAAIVALPDETQTSSKSGPSPCGATVPLRRSPAASVIRCEIMDSMSVIAILHLWRNSATWRA